ncbi:alkyl/aryl-sulfatase [Shewanella sp. D64]|uniref:alkyl/aryl-sulfatase n=1 Tax=unclassified Shewanella TaxID=196818 RepID=UPI0022BA6034|nr:MULTISPECIES: alkyl/aryl-sulfatase [unclassified Shewanella]MEC4728765.1 alkyl/aryl-sulfatase [Shewanella sp. D64]MEC4740209.1 alkyl/aryl-sulfatase [Shewanella sp. E94]WBJ96261.1 alkyl/aryl-sulfatase [Shewanella sp. MTB7]
MKHILYFLSLSAALCAPLSASTLVSVDVASAMLKQHEQHFEQRIVKVAPNIYTAVGYHGATSSMIVGEDGVIIIDTLMGPTSANNALIDFRKHSTKPVKAIIYTHSHGDHTGGASTFSQGQQVEVIGHANMGNHHGTDKVLDVVMAKRETRQFGRLLEPEYQSNRGVAQAITIDHDRGKGFIPPSLKIHQNYKTTIAGIDIEIYPAAGETSDAMFIWLPNEQVLFSGDNFYQAFLNLYAIRGTPYRDLRIWSESVATMATFEPNVLVGGHTSPILGQVAATQALLDYSEAIASVYEQTTAGMNKGLDPVTIAQTIKLPTHLQNKPYLTEFYGTVSHASRAIYAGMLGWFDGNPTHLNPLSNKVMAEQLALLAGGHDKLMIQLDKAMKIKNHQWALILTDHLSYLDDLDKTQVVKAQIFALRALAAQEYNAPNRNYYFSYAAELERKQGNLN